MNMLLRISMYVAGISLVGIGLSLFYDPVLQMTRLAARIDFGENNIIAGGVFIVSGLWIIIGQYKEPKLKG